MRWKRPEPRPQTYWAPHFALFPVLLENTGERVWLEWVWRHTERYEGGMGDAAIVDRFRDDVHWGAANLPFDKSSGHQTVKP